MARRLFQLVAFAICAGMAAAAPVPGDGVAGAVEGRRIFHPPPEAGPLKKRAPLVRVRSMSELTRVHPAVDILRALR